MNWSSYTLSEKYKIIKSKIIHNNIVCIALHTYNLELFKKILLTENVSIDDIYTRKLIYHGIVGKGKYNVFFQELCNYLNDRFSSDKEELLNVIPYLENILNGKCIETYNNLLSDKPLLKNHTNNEQLQSKFSEEETLEYYYRTSKDLSTHNIKYHPQPEILPELNYAELDWYS